jgi:poly(A) polymerase
VLRQYGLFGRLYPTVAAQIEREGELGISHQLLQQAMENIDQRLARDKPVTPVFLFAALAYPALRGELGGRPLEEATPEEVLQAGDRALDTLVEWVALPRRYRAPLQEIWQLQPRFSQRNGKRALRLLAQPRFSAAYAFLLLRAGAGEADPALADWWTEIQQADADRQHEMLAGVSGEGGSRSRSGRRRRRRSRATGGEGG